MDSTRLRKAFKYPADENDENSHDEMDEEEQEHLLQNLQESEMSTNAIYTIAFTSLPLVVIVPFLWYLFRSTARSTVLLCLLSITSLASSSYMMYMVPVSTPLGSLSAPSRTTPAGQQRASGISQSSFLITSAGSPINQFLPWLNALIGVLLFLASWAYRSRSDVPEGLWLFLLLPGLIFGMVVIARRSMAEVESGLGQLRGMRYGYKGA